MNYAKDLSCYSHWHFGYDLSRCAHPTQRGQLSLNPVMPPPMARSNLRLWCPKLFGYLPPKYFQRNQRSVILFRLSSLSRLPPWRFWSSIIFLGCLLASSVTEIETFFRLSPKTVRDDFSVVGPIFTSVRFRERFHFLFWLLGGSKRSQAPEIVKSSPSTLALGIKLKMNILIIPLADIFSCEGTNWLH